MVFSPAQLAELRSRVRQLGASLQLSGAVQTEAHNLAAQLAPDWYSTRRMTGAVLAAACVFITSRLNQLPVTMVSVALASQVRPEALSVR